MATVSKWTPFGVALNITATGSNVIRKSATQYTVKINVSWQTYWNGAKTNYGMIASSGGGSATINTFGVKSSGGSGSFVGTFYINGNGSATKTIAVTFRNFNTDNGDSKTTTLSFNVTIPAWTSYTVKYNANGGSNAPASQTKWKGQTLKLSTTKPTRSGYEFQGWATVSNGNVVYASGSNYTADASITLYAVWKSITYTIKYNANGGSNAPASQTKTHGKTLILSSLIPIRTSIEDNGAIIEYTFKGWSTSPTATSVLYNAGSIYTSDISVTLYAVWSKSVSLNTYDVSYNTNGGSEVISQVKIKGKILVLRDTVPIKNGYTFAGWGASSDSTSVLYESGSNYATDEDIILYAIWTPWRHTVTFDSNGGIGSVPEDFVKATGIDNVIIPNCSISRKNHVFKYWCTQSDGSGGERYYVGDGYTGIKNGGIETLYAIWDITNVYLHKNGKCNAGEFIEDDRFGFKNDGTAHYNEFIESGTSIKFSSTAFYASELLERVEIYLTDESDVYLTDESGNYLTTII